MQVSLAPPSVQCHRLRGKTAGVAPPARAGMRLTSLVDFLTSNRKTLKPNFVGRLEYW